MSQIPLRSHSFSVGIVEVIQIIKVWITKGVVYLQLDSLCKICTVNSCFQIDMLLEPCLPARNCLSCGEPLFVHVWNSFIIILNFTAILW